MLYIYRLNLLEGKIHVSAKATATLSGKEIIYERVCGSVQAPDVEISPFHPPSYSMNRTYWGPIYFFMDHRSTMLATFVERVCL